jgi:Skp family chaperone for outer membrane proteins
MSNRVQQLLDQIRSLRPEEIAELETALAEKRWTDDDWDRQMRADAAAGKLDKLIEQAERDAGEGRVHKFP